MRAGSGMCNGSNSRSDRTGTSRNALYLLLQVAVPLILLTAVANAWAAVQTRVNSNPLVPTTQQDCSVSGDRVVWADWRGSSTNLYVKNVDTGIETTLCDAPGEQDYPVIDGDRVVWQDKRNGNWDIYMKDLSSGIESVVCTATGDQEEPDIDGDRVVWTDHRNYDVGSGDSKHYEDIYMKNLDTGAETVVSQELTGETMPAISGDIVTWVRWTWYSNPRKHNCRVQWKDLVTGQKLGFGEGYSRDQDIYGNIMVFFKGVFDNEDNMIGSQIVGFNVRTGEADLIADAPLGDDRGKSYPKIDDGLVLWHEYDSGDRTYNIVTKPAFSGVPVTTHHTSTTYAGGAVISGDRIAWTDARGGSFDSDIYTKTIPGGPETLVTSDDMVPTWQRDPVIGGNRVVWSDGRTKDDSTDYMYTKNLATDIEEPVVCTEIALLPDISGDVLVWWNYKSGKSDIKMKNLATGTEEMVCDNSFFQSYPAISGDLVVWGDSRNSTDTGGYNDTDIYLKDLSTGIESAIVVTPTVQTKPANSGNLVVWEDSRNATSTGTDVWSRRLGETEKPVTEATGTQQDVAVCDNVAVWEDYRSDPDGDIWMRDMASSAEETAIATGTAAQIDPAIWGRTLVWIDNRDGYPTLRAKDIITGDERVLVDSPAAKPAHPDIYGGRIVWEDSREGDDIIPDSNIYTTTVDLTTTPTTLTTQNVSTALAGYNGNVTLTGALNDASGTPVGYGMVEVWGAPAGGDTRSSRAIGTWTKRAIAVWDADSQTYAATVRVIENTYVQMRFRGNATYEPYNSDPVLVRSSAYLGLPWTYPKTVRRNRAFYVFGYLKPRHSGYTRLYFYRQIVKRWRGRIYRSWRYYATRYARNYNYGSYTRYRLAYRLRYPGYYRVRAYHSDASHVPTLSGIRLFRVR